MDIFKNMVGILPTNLEMMCKDPKKIPKTITERVIQMAAKKVVVCNNKLNLSFSIVNTPTKWEQIRKLRLDVYRNKLPYMSDVLDKNGTDEFDSRSVVFGCWYNGKAVATIRFTKGPFEISNFISTNQEKNIFQDLKPDKTLEFSRLIVASDVNLSRVLPGLLIYTGLHIAVFTDYDYYIGYTKTSVYNKLKHFMVSTIGEPFSIHTRGNHSYQILQGCFRDDYEKLVDKLVKPTFLANGIKRLYGQPA